MRGLGLVWCVSFAAACGGGSGGSGEPDAWPPPPPDARWLGDWTATASDGTSEEHVHLECSGPSDVGPVTIQWERARYYNFNDIDPNDIVILDATTPVHDDATLPAGAVTNYRCRVTASDGATAVSSVDLGHRLARASELARRDTWVTDERVHAVALGDGVIYLGGEFEYVGPPNGNFGGVDAATGAWDPTASRIVGGINDVVGDGAGGWYVGGSLLFVDGLPRGNLIHLDAAGRLDTAFAAVWTTPYEIRALAADGAAVYLAGYFTAVSAEERRGLAAVDATTGALRSWNPGLGGAGPAAVQTLALDGDTLYLGGTFAQVAGQPRHHVAAVDTATGAATAFNPNTRSGAHCDEERPTCDYPSVSAIAIGDGAVYVAGDFESMGGQPRRSLAALDPITGAATAWNPIGDAPWSGYLTALAVRDGTVFVGGGFETIAGQARKNVAAISAATGSPTSWNPAPDGRVDAIVAGADRVHLGGAFTTLGGEPRRHVAEVDVATGAVTSWVVGVDEPVTVLGIGGGRVRAGGTWVTSVGGVRRARLAAIDLTTGAPTSWDPGADDAVLALELRGSTLYAGGEFTAVGGESRSRIAAVDATSGAATSWNPGADFPVHALAANDTIVYAGGDFTTIGGEARSGVAALDATSGAATAWQPPGEFPELTRLLLDGNTLYIAGGPYSTGPWGYVGSIDATTGAHAWLAPVEGGVYTMTLGEGTLYVGGLIFALGGWERFNLGAIDTTTGRITEWAPVADGPYGMAENDGVVTALAYRDGVVYTSGDFTKIAGEHHTGLAALDADTGALVPAWNPGLGWALGLVVDGATLYYHGFGSGRVSGWPGGGLVIFDL